jgi:murein L,D-transpeptidase YcbB/YkuD
MPEDYEVEELELAEDEAVKNLETSPEAEELKLPEVEVAPVVVPSPTPTSVSSKRKTQKSSSVESSIGEVEVVVEALKFQARSRKSLSVAALQDRLAELGHGSSRRDLRGWLSDGTVEALTEFQTEAGLEATGVADRETVEAIMRGTKAEVV